MTEMTISISNDSMIPSLKKILGSLSWVSNIKVKRNRKAKASKMASETDPATAAFVKKFCGKSPDERDADEIISDIYSSRKNKDMSYIENAFK